VGNNGDLKKVMMPQAFDAIPVATQQAVDAYKLVLAEVGASAKRDTLDQRIINDVKNRAGRIIDVQGGYPHGTAYEKTKNAWPVLKSLPAPKDSDQDGMPDAWEVKNKMDPAKANGSGKNLDKHYTNIEMYINSLAENAKKD
jgi:hypothetical protein